MTVENLSRAMGGIRLAYIMEAEEYMCSEFVRPRRVWRTLLIAAIIVCFMTATAFAVGMFSSISGDTLSLSAQYLGQGVVELEIENRSERELRLEETVRLIYYKDKSPVPGLGGEVLFSDTLIPPGEISHIQVDISAAYDVAMLEEILRNDFYCLQISNSSFLPGQRWTCIVNFRPGADSYVPANHETGEHALTGEAEPELSWYFKSFTDDIFVRWTDAAEYFELVEKLIKEQGLTVAEPVEAYLLPDKYDWLMGLNYSCFDGYNKIVGRRDSDKALISSVYVPYVNENGITESSVLLPLFYIFTYELEQTQSPESCAFVRGCFLSFEEMEQYKIYQDESYVMYEMSPLFYTELQPYIEDMLLQIHGMYMDEQIRQRIQRCYEHFSKKEVWEDIIYYHPDEARPRNILTLEDILRISQKPDSLSYMDFADFYGRHEPDLNPAVYFEMDGDFELVYSMYPSGEPRDFRLYHLPSGDSVDIEREDVKAFISAHS